ncbi:hypothetical protein Tco_1218413 [Tanacetum coccineum]
MKCWKGVWRPRLKWKQRGDQGACKLLGCLLGDVIEREVAKSVEKIEEYRRLCIELRVNIRLRNDYISEFKLYRRCDDILSSIAMLRRMQSDDTKNVARLLSLARETQQKVDELTAFIRRIREHIPGTPLCVSMYVPLVMANGGDRFVSQVVVNGVSDLVPQGTVNGVIANGVGESVPQGMVNGVMANGVMANGVIESIPNAGVVKTST